MNNLTTYIEEKRKKFIETMIEKGMQVPLNKLLSNKEILSLQIRGHVVERYHQRFERLYEIQIENEIKSTLLTSGMIVEKGHSGRWKVHSQGFIFVLDKDSVYTVYDANGRDKNNIVDPTKSKLNKIYKKTNRLQHLNELFNAI